MCIYRLPKLIQRLHQNAPKLEVLLVHEPFDYDTALAQGEIDAAITVTHPSAMSGTLKSTWQSQLIQQEEVIYVCTPEKKIDHTLSLEQLNQQALITTEPECSYRMHAEQQFRQCNLTLNARQSFSNVEVIKRCVLDNMGIGLLPRCVVEEELASKKLVQQPVKGAPYYFNSLLLYPKREQQADKILALLATLNVTI